METWWDRKEVNNELQLQSYIQSLNGFSFVSLRLYIIQIHISEPIGQHMTSPPPPHFVTFSAFQQHISLAEWLHRHASQHSDTHVFIANTHVHMRPPSVRFSTYFILSARSRVYVHCHVVTYSRHFLLRYSHGTFFCNVLNVRLRLHPLTDVCSTPTWSHLPDISIFPVATHSFSHICTLSNTHFCPCLHCHYYDVSSPYIRK
jgi:hypothetical protein